MTRPRDSALALGELVRAVGGTPLIFPTVEIAEPPDPAALEAALRGLSNFDLAIFVSPTAARSSLAALRALGMVWPAGLPAAAIGPGTRDTLERAGVTPVIVPQGAQSESLLDLPALRVVHGKKVVIFRGQAGRELLSETLAQRGANVHFAQCYTRLHPEGDPTPVREALHRDALHAVTVFSGGALRNLLQLVGDVDSEALLRLPLFVGHPRVAEQAARLRAVRVTVAGPGNEEMVAGLVAYFSGRK